MHETHLAIAFERSVGINTRPVLTKRSVLGTFVDVDAGLAVAGEASVTDALVATRQIDTPGSQHYFT